VLFTKYLRDGVRSGAITRSVRVWIRPHVRVGGRYRFEEGEIEIDSIAPITLDQITPRLARQCGFASPSDLLRSQGMGEAKTYTSSSSITLRRRATTSRRCTRPGSDEAINHLIEYLFRLVEAYFICSRLRDLSRQIIGARHRDAVSEK
jgi:hypothetical protein